MPTPRHWLRLNLILAKTQADSVASDPVRVLTRSPAQAFEAIADALSSDVPVVDISPFDFDFNGRWMDCDPRERHGNTWKRVLDLSSQGMINAPWPRAVFVMFHGEDQSKSDFLVGVARWSTQEYTDGTSSSGYEFECTARVSSKGLVESGGWAPTLMYASLMASALVSARGTEWKEAEPNRIVRRHAPRVAAIRFRHIVLKCDTPARRKSVNRGSSVYDGTPFHHRRGHFAYYGPDKPLFGKYVGWVWRPYTVVGDKVHGTIHQSYSIKADNSPEAIS